MRFGLTNCIGVAALLSVMTVPALAQQASGSFQNSCRNIQNSGQMLTADCADRAGTYHSSSIAFGQCKGDIGNNNGVLTCNGATATINPQNAYRSNGYNGNRAEANRDRGNNNPNDRGFAPGGGNYGGGTTFYRPSFLPRDEDDYWGVESYDDFNNDYRHIYQEIRTGTQNGDLSRRDADSYIRQLRLIRQRADRLQRSGRFDPDAIEGQLVALRRSIHWTERGGDNRDRSYGR